MLAVEIDQPSKKAGNLVSGLASQSGFLNSLYISRVVPIFKILFMFALSLASHFFF